MFQTIVPIWIRELSGGRPASEVDFESHGFAALEDDGDDLGPPGLPDDDSAQAVLDIVVLEGSDAPQLDQGQRDKEARWDEFNKRVRAGTQEFAKMPVLQSCLAITRQSMIPHIRLTSKLLNLSSEDWCREAFSASFRSQPRYRVFDCASGRHTASFFDDVRMRMRQTEFWESVPLEERSLMTSGLAFRLLSRGAGSVTLYLAQAHRQYPFKLFLAVLGEDEGKVSEVHHDPECTRDRFAKAHCKKYNTVEKLKSFESKLELKCTAVLARTDIVPCERSHSGLRRTTLRGLQTWRRTLLQCSADVFLATQRRREAPCRSSKGGVKRARRRMKLGLKPPSQKPRAKKYRAKMAAKGRSGRQGVKNAWNVFWREQQVGLQGLPTKRRRQEISRVTTLCRLTSYSDLRARRERGHNGLVVCSTQPPRRLWPGKTWQRKAFWQGRIRRRRSFSLPT
jgi:hypothetical protein